MANGSSTPPPLGVAHIHPTNVRELTRAGGRGPSDPFRPASFPAPLRGSGRRRGPCPGSTASFGESSSDDGNGDGEEWRAATPAPRGLGTCGPPTRTCGDGPGNAWGAGGGGGGWLQGGGRNPDAKLCSKSVNRGRRTVNFRCGSHFKETEGEGEKKTEMVHR